MMRLGILSYQSNGSADVFAVQEVWENGVEYTDEVFLNITDPQFDSYATWLNGRIPTFKPVNIEGDTVSIQARFKGDYFIQSFYITLYVEYELAEEVMDVSSEKRDQQQLKERGVEVYM